MRFPNKHRFAMVAVAAAVLSACGGGSGPSSCSETGTYACQTGSTEPLSTYQWILNASQSYFAQFVNFMTGDANGISDATSDLNVNPVYQSGIKGQGVNVLVIDDGVDSSNPDLKVDLTSSHNFDDGSANDNVASDPTPGPATPVDTAHGTNAAGIIAALQNGVGVMGVAPRVNLGGARFVGVNGASTLAAYGGADWSKNADIINASFGSNPVQPAPFDTTNPSDSDTAIQNFPTLRNGKGLVFIKAAGNEFSSSGNRDCLLADVNLNGNTVKANVASCDNPANDTETLYPMVLTIAAGNSKGQKASYSSAGSIIWATGLGGEDGLGNYGEYGPPVNGATQAGGPYLDTSSGSVVYHGPQLFSTDLVGKARGYARDGQTTGDVSEFTRTESAVAAKLNSNGNYSTMNGTSAATPTVSGVVALMLSANPKLTWRDVREILALTSRKIDSAYNTRLDRNLALDLTQTTPTYTANTGAIAGKTAPVDGATEANLELGYVKNAANYQYSNWYGFGLVDAAAAVNMAKSYSTYKPATYTDPGNFASGVTNGQLTYGQITKIGTFSVAGAQKVDMMELQLNSPNNDVCVGALGIALVSPAGTVSYLSVPYNIFYKASNNGGNDVKLASNGNYALGSFAFYGEAAAGTWSVYAVSANPESSCATAGSTASIDVGYRIFAAQ